MLGEQPFEFVERRVPAPIVQVALFGILEGLLDNPHQRALLDLLEGDIDNSLMAARAVGLLPAPGEFEPTWPVDDGIGPRADVAATSHAAVERRPPAAADAHVEYMLRNSSL